MWRSFSRIGVVRHLSTSREGGRFLGASHHCSHVRFSQRVAAGALLPRPLDVKPSYLGCRTESRRGIFGWLNAMFNTVDEQRIKEIGPDGAAAEWLLRCGGGVRWVGHPNVTKDYNLLTHKASGAKIEVIDATEACIMSIGFPHLRGLTEVKELKLVRCSYLDDEAFAYLKNLKKLERLEIISCGNVTNKGLEYVKDLKQLKDLVLFDLPEIDLEAAVEALRAALPGTRVEFLTADPSSVPS